MRQTLTWCLLVVAAAVAVVSIPELSWAQEAVTTTVETAVAPAAAPVVDVAPAPVWFGEVQLWEVVAAIVAAIWGIIKAKLKIDADWEKKVVSFFEAGVQHTYDTLIREAKKTAPGGKLTKEQIDEARKLAWEAAKAYAASQGVDLAKQIVAEQIPVWITRVWNNFEKDKVESVAPAVVAVPTAAAVVPAPVKPA